MKYVVKNFFEKRRIRGEMPIPSKTQFCNFFTFIVVIFGADNFDIFDFLVNNSDARLFEVSKDGLELINQGLHLGVKSVKRGTD